MYIVNELCVSFHFSAICDFPHRHPPPMADLAFGIEEAIDIKYFRSETTDFLL